MRLTGRSRKSERITTVSRRCCGSVVVVAAICVTAVLLSCGASPVAAMNVLAVQTVPGKSHWNVMSAVLRALTDRGHNVTVFTPFLDGDRERYTEVAVTGAVMQGSSELDAEELIETIGTASALIIKFVVFARAVCDTVFRHPRMAEILRHGGRGPSAAFDVVVIEPMASECVSYVATVLRVPLIYVVPSPIVTYMERSLSGHAPNPAVVAHLLSRHGAPVTFAERLANVLLTVYGAWLKWYSDVRQRRLNPQPYDAVDLVKPSLTFTNTHFITEPSRPLTPDIVQVGGLHLSRPKGIPEDILEFIEGSPHGVIYFTFGSVVLMSSLPENAQNAFKQVFARLPQRVLWKYEGEMTDKPENVMTKKWFPQRDVLLHPNVKLFVSHGGISGVYEAVDAGVPILGFPFCYDQPRNLENLVDAGMAISMDLLTVNKDTLLKAVSALVNEERYRKNAKIASERFKDRPMSPAKSVVYWTEYVVRHKGAPHLKSHAIDLTWYEYILVDVIATFLFATIVVSLIVYYCLKTIYLYTIKYFQNAKRKRE